MSLSTENTLVKKLLHHYGENFLIFAIINVDPSLKAQEES